jgi:hypothetical protein
VDDLVDEIQRVLGAHSEAHERDIRTFAHRRGADLGDIHFPGDDLMTEGFYTSDAGSNNALHGAWARAGTIVCYRAASTERVPGWH